MMKKLFFLITLLLILAFPILIAQAQSSGTIWLESPTNTYQPTDIFPIYIKATLPEPISAFSFQLAYDPACIQITEYQSGAFLPNAQSVSNSSQVGLLDVMYTSLDASVSMTGTDTLVEIEATAVNACETEIQLIGMRIFSISDDAGIQEFSNIDLGITSLIINLTRAEPTVIATATPTPDANSSIPGNDPYSTSTQGTTPTPTKPPKFYENWFGLPMVITLSITVISTVLILMRIRQQPSFAPNLVVPRATPCLFIERGPEAGQTLPLVKFPCSIGRGDANDISLSSRHVSRQHAQIYVSQNIYHLADLGSKNGTFINGRRVRHQSTKLHPGDRLKLGRDVLAVFRLQIDSDLTI